MSWDVLLMKCPLEVKSLGDMPSDFRPEPLGRREALISLLKEVLPSIDFAGPSWGKLDGNSYTMEFNMGDAELIESIMLHVRGGDAALEAVRLSAEALSARALDLSAGEFLDFAADPERGLREWREYRDKVVAETGDKSTEPAG